MHFPIRVVLAAVWLAGGCVTPAVAQTGTLQVPAKPYREQPIKPPTAAPRIPVTNVAERTERAHKPSGHKVPVVAPRKGAHPQKPETAAEPLPVPVPPIPPGGPAAPAPGETKAAPAPDKSADAEKPEGAKIPRFVSLRSDDVNMRAGPGTRYRIEWVYRRRDLPVEIEREFDVWRWVRDPDGIEGWVHQATLMGRRSFMVQHADATLRSSPNDTASPVAILKVGVIGWIRSCEAGSEWCRVQTGTYRGYLRRDQFWGTLPDEAINP